MKRSMLNLHLKLKDDKIIIEPYVMVDNKKIDFENYIDFDYCNLQKIKTDIVLANKYYNMLSADIIEKVNNKYLSSSNNFFQLINIFSKSSNIFLDKQLDIIKSGVDFNKTNSKTIYPGISQKLILRKYQHLGVSWLWSLYQLKSGCILADDMGLGKTVQIIALISKIYNTNINKPILIVAPLSVVSNWKNELSKFCNFKFEEFHGKERNSYFMNPSNILLSSYGTLNKSIKKFKNVNFSLCVFDEGQKLKNFKSESAISAASINADSKIVLSGTPVENNWSELWSLFNITNKNYLCDNLNDFKNLYLNEIDKNLYQPKPILFNKTKYFILSRKKKEVLKELPPKIYHNKYSNLTKVQINCYKDILDDSKMEPLVKFTNLLKITSHPQIYDSKHNNIQDSGKINSLIDLLRNLDKPNEKIIVFARYKEIINTILSIGEKNQLNCQFISGEIKKESRSDIINNFNKSKGNQLLILSYQTSALGININTATSIIHYDRWWNPAIEKQAEDRAYRFGRKNNLFVYKLITRSSLDEKILKLHKNKNKMLNDILIKGSTKNSELIDSLLTTLKDEINDFK